MLEITSNALASLRLIMLLMITGITCYFCYYTDLTADAGFIGWYFGYTIFIILMLRKSIQGKIYHPIVLVGSSYFLLLIVGAILYPWLNERPLHPVVFNLIGIGFIALLGGIQFGLLIPDSKRHDVQPASLHNQLFVYLLAGLGIAATLYMFISFKGIPLLASNPNDAKVRFLVGNGIFNLFFKGLPVFAIALLYVRHANRQHLWPAHLYCFTILILIVAAGYRSSTLITIGEYVCFFLIIAKRQIPMKWVITAGILALLFLGVLGAYRRGNDGIAGAYQEMAIVVQARPALFESIVRNFDSDNYFHGSLYYNDFKRFLPGLQTNANVDLKYAIFPNADSMPDIAGVTPSVAGEAYMNYGKGGVFWILLLVGFLLGFSYQWANRKPDFLRLAFYLTFVFGMAGGVQSGIGLKLIHLTQFWIWVFIIGFLLRYRIYYKTPGKFLTHSI